MKAVAERGDEDEETATPSEAQLLDVLYELLAQGIHPRTSPSRAEIEQFLHEHARDRKSEGELLRFFAEHELPTDASLIGSDAGVSELALGLQRERGSIPPQGEGGRDSHPSLTREVSRRDLHDDVVGDDATTQRGVAVRASRRLSRGLVMLPVSLMATAATLGLSAAFYLTHQRASTLAAELEEARANERASAFARTELEQTTERLQHALTESEGALRAEIARNERARSDEEKRRRREAAALARVLGQHYPLVRQRLEEALAKSGR